MSEQPSEQAIADFYKSCLETGGFTIDHIIRILAECEYALQTPCPTCGESRR